MGKLILFGVVTVICLGSLAFGAGQEAGAKELVSNPLFEEAELPAGIRGQSGL
jgi:hypothetical protein